MVPIHCPLHFPCHQTLPAFPSWGEEARPSCLLQCDTSPYPFISSLQTFSLTWVNLQFIPPALPSISPPWSRMARCRGLCLKTLLLLHVQMQLEAACHLGGLSSPCMVVLGQKPRMKMYAGSCPKESSFIGACFWLTGILNHEMEAPGGLQSIRIRGTDPISLPLPSAGPATPLPQLSYSP